MHFILLTLIFSIPSVNFILPAPLDYGQNRNVIILCKNEPEPLNCFICIEFGRKFGRHLKCSEKEKKSVSSKSFPLIRFDYVIRRGRVERKRGDVMER